MHKVVISDASTIIGLQNINHLDILKSLYQNISITSIVSQEVGNDLPEWITIDDSYDENIYNSLIKRLDNGEASSIALAVVNKGCLLIVDEKKGRDEAKQLGINITGVIGVVMRAKKEGEIKSGKELLDKLINIGFRISDKIYHLALEQMGE